MVLALFLAVLVGTNNRAFADSPETDITREGSVQASTTAVGYPAAWSIDGDPSTSWFSTGPEPNGVPTRFQWTHPRDDLITTIYIHGNGQNNVKDFRTGYGFGSVTVQVLDASGKVVFQQAVQLPGTPDPDVLLHPNVVGRTVLLLLSGHESKDCGGFSELQVKANRAAAPTATPSTIPPTLTQVNPVSANSASIIASDDMNRVDGDSCHLGALDNALGGSRTLYYLPLFPAGGTDPTHPIGASLASGALQNNGNDFGGVQFAAAPPCQSPLGVVRGVNLGQDLNIRVSLLVPADVAGHLAQAGPFVRSRAAAYGDGIIGGASAGYWVRLENTGEVTIRRLNPYAAVAFSGKLAGFDSTTWHTLEIAAGGTHLQVSFDGKLLTFNQDGQLTTTVTITPTAGSNDGTAGIAFGAEANRGQIGGQRAKTIIITVYSPLDGLPVQNNFSGASAPVALPTATLAATNVATGVATSVVTSFATPASTSVAAAPLGTPSGTNALPGDCDGDGKITEADALCALEMSIGLRPVSLQMDMDHSGDVTSRDAVILLQQAVGK